MEEKDQAIILRDEVTDQVVHTANKRAPNTVGLGIIGLILGAAMGGPGGGVLGAMIGSMIGASIDEES